VNTQAVSLFINPTAGRGRAGLRSSRIEDTFTAAGIACHLQMSKAVGDLESQVYDAVRNGANRIVVAGGDGSIHEAVNGLMRSGGSAALGIIPTGTGNDFAKACAIPLDWERATQQLVDRLSAAEPIRFIDIGRVNNRFFANGAGIGFDAKVTRVARSYRWPVGDVVYLLAIFRCMIDGIATPDLTIRSDEFEWRGPVTLANVSNGAWVGGMFHITPMASNNDGKLELLIAAPVSRLRILSLLPKIIRGTHLSEPEVTHTSVRRLVVMAAEPVPSHLDGEVQALESNFDIEVLPAALGLL